MKLNNKGFAISTIMYMILILAVILIIATLSILGSRKLIIDRVKDETLNNIYKNYNGYQLYPADKILFRNSKWSWKRLPNDWIEATCDNTSGTSTVFGDFYIPISDSILKESTKYYLIVEVPEISNTIAYWLGDANTNTQFTTTDGYPTNAVINTKGIHIKEVTTVDDFTNISTYGIYQFLYVTSGLSAKIRFRTSIYEVPVSLDTFVYEPYIK